MELNTEKTLTRRDALKTLAAITGAAALAAAPGRWETPIVEVGALPAHAQTSGEGENLLPIMDIRIGTGVVSLLNMGFSVSGGQFKNVTASDMIRVSVYPRTGDIVLVGNGDDTGACGTAFSSDVTLKSGVNFERGKIYKYVLSCDGTYKLTDA
jgi:hypothetical protein